MRLRKNKPKNLVWVMFSSNRLAVVGLALLALIILMAILAPVLAPYDPTQMDLRSILQGPSAKHFFGTDALGRDIFSRVLFGARISLLVGIKALSITYAFGIPLGIISGYYSGNVDYVMQRFIDILMAFPLLLIALLVIAIIGVGLNNAMIAVGIGIIGSTTRLVRGVVLQLRTMPFIEASKALGVNDIKIMIFHVLPNCLSPIIVQASILMGVTILAAAALGFLGLGAQPPTPEWGAMLSSARENIVEAPHVAAFPGLMILLTVLAFNFIGDGLRDALDPRLRR